MKTQSLTAAALMLTLACSGDKKSDPGENEVAVTAVGEASGSPVQTLVPTTGASLASADGRLLVEIPDGALTASQTLSVQAISNESPGGVGAAYRLGPEGTTFAKPVKLTFTYNDDDLAGSDASGLQVAYQDALGQWNALKSSTLASAKITVETTHFSDWSLVEGYQLRPARATVKQGQTVDFEVFGCSNRVDGTDELAELRFICRPDSELFDVQEWAANGVAHGNASTGKFAIETDTSATYTAPNTTPANNPVAISATTIDKSTNAKIVLTANVLVDDHPVLTGTVNSTQKEDVLGFTLTTVAHVTFKWNEANQWYVPAPPSTLSVTYDIVGQDCTTHGAFMKDLGATDGTIIITELGYFATGATTGTIVGTTGCGGSSEPFELTEEIEWWPSPVEELLGVKPDGKLDDGFVNQILASGKTVSADWTLVPTAQ